MIKGSATLTVWLTDEVLSSNSISFDLLLLQQLRKVKWNQWKSNTIKKLIILLHGLFFYIISIKQLEIIWSLLFGGGGGTTNILMPCSLMSVYFSLDAVTRYDIELLSIVKNTKHNMMKDVSLMSLMSSWLPPRDQKLSSSGSLYLLIRPDQTEDLKQRWEAYLIYSNNRVWSSEGENTRFLHSNFRSCSPLVQRNWLHFLFSLTSLLCLILIMVKWCYFLNIT